MMRFLILIVALLSAVPSPAAPPLTVRCAFWNIQWFPGRHPNASAPEEKRQIGAVQRDLASAQLDILGMEEVRDFHNAGLAVAALPGFKVDVCSNFPPREGQNVGQQVAIASRLTPMSAWIEGWKTSGALLPPRGFAFAAYEIAPRQLLLVYALHLKSNRGEITEDIAIREESIRQLVVHMKAMRNAYAPLGNLSWIVGGDYNTAPDDPRFTAEKSVRSLLDNGFQWSWRNIPFAQRISLPADNFFPAACFDHIFYRDAVLLDAHVIPTSRSSSDHRAIFAAFQL